MKVKIGIAIIIYMLYINIANAWIINNEIQRRGYPEYVNTDYEYNRTREFISQMEMNLFIVVISKGNRNKLMEIQDMGYMTDKKDIIKNIKTLLIDLRSYSYLIKNNPMKEQTNDLVLKGLTDKKFELTKQIDKLESEGKDAHLIEVRLERVKNDINSIIKN